MAERKPYLLRLPRELMEELERWAKDDLRSLNAQIEFVLREAIRRRRRDFPKAPASSESPPESAPPSAAPDE